jgi:hypothetical protein
MGFTGRSFAYVHGEQVGPRHFHNYVADFRISIPQRAGELEVSEDWVSRGLSDSQGELPFSCRIGYRLIRARESQIADTSLRLGP